MTVFTQWMLNIKTMLPVSTHSHIYIEYYSHPHACPMLLCILFLFLTTSCFNHLIVDCGPCMWPGTWLKISNWWVKNHFNSPSLGCLFGIGCGMTCNGDRNLGSCPPHHHLTPPHLPVIKSWGLSGIWEQPSNTVCGDEAVWKIWQIKEQHQQEPNDCI